MRRPATYEVHAQPVDGGRELVALVQPPLFRTPVEPFPPIRDQLPQIRGVGAELPSAALERLGNASQFQTGPQILERRVRHVDAKWDDAITVPLGANRARR